jgi:site-specific recombinase XerD
MKTQLRMYDVIDKYLYHLYDMRDESVAPEEVEDTLQNFASYIWGMQITINQVTTEDIAMYFNNLQGHQGRYHRVQQAKIKPGEYDVIVQRIQKFWDWASYVFRMSNPFIPENLAELSSRIHPINTDKLKHLIKLLDDKVQLKNDHDDDDAKKALRDIALLLVMLDAGPRVEELARMKIDDVDQTNRMVVIREVRNQVRNVPVSGKLLPRLNAYIQSRYPGTVRGDALLFPKDDEGNPLDGEATHEILVNLGNMVGLNDINALQFRAAFAKNYHEADMLDNQLIGLMGIYNNQQLRLYIDRFGNKKLKRLWEEYYRSFRSTDPVLSDV